VAPVGGPYYTSLSVPLTLSDGSDAASGLYTSSAIVERDVATLSGGSCGSYSGSWSTVSLVSGADTSVTSGHCYKYRYKISDNVSDRKSVALDNSAEVGT